MSDVNQATSLRASKQSSPGWQLALAALGIVYGDIGTSPLYAFREALLHIPMTTNAIYGVLSLIFWSFIIVISLKYLSVVLRADNEGEGGIVALAALLRKNLRSFAPFFLLFAVVGTGLIVGDGMLTPAISVLSAVEGLEFIAPHLAHFVVPITVSLLLLLFFFQYKGSGNIGKCFGPFVLCWFILLGVLGLREVIQYPEILKGMNPIYAIKLTVEHRWAILPVLGGVFLVITGGEALYADIGHFGKKPIRLAWFTVVLPGLVLNYFGQAAYLLHHSDAIQNPFYSIAPAWFVPFLIVISAIATIIASQAIISAVFSILKQSILLNLIPRTKIVFTSKEHYGQIYLPLVNFILCVGTCALVIYFQSSTGLANAYGIAVNMDMLLTSILTFLVALFIWRWKRVFVFLVFGAFLLIDISFFAGNIHKIAKGGLFPIMVAGCLTLIMMTWVKGYERLRAINYRRMISSHFIFDELERKKIRRLPGTALFITDPYDQQGGGLLHHLKVNQILSKCVIFLSVIIQDVAHVQLKEKFELIEKAEGFYHLNVYYGFAENIHIPKALAVFAKQDGLPFELHIDEISYFIEMISVNINQKNSHFFFWQKWLFAAMLRNAVPDIQFYHLPYNRTVALGTYCEL